MLVLGIGSTVTCLVRAQDRAALPLSVAPEKTSDLYGKAQPVVLSGYEGSAMEPFLSPDGRFLFFNNENDPAVNTNLHFAERTGKLSFRYLGELPGANSPVLDAAPSMDTSGRIYFTTVREYRRTLNSIYAGEFDGKRVANVRPLAGDINPKTLGTINMDVGISPDGRSLYVSRAVIVPGEGVPRKSELLLATRKDGAFHIDPDGPRILNNIATPALQYAPCISADGLELYFTRASQPTSITQSPVRILMATRESANASFGEARVLKELDGFVEAPTVSLDGKEMFFHKKAGSRFVIYRAERKMD